ncbi:hypothetical protein AC1031_016944 [Aphanomyces cochlioides]|nr:hypothetical protein AC1031_016944 [Aphanomyces cochlioides]
MDPRRPIDPNLLESTQDPSSVPQPPDRPESETALIPHPSSPNTRKRYLRYRIQHHANSPEQLDDEKRVRPDSYLALPAPESDLSDDSMDPRSSSEDFPMSDETALAIASSMPLPDDRNDLFLSESDEIATTDGMPRDIMPYGDRDLVPLATRTAIVERTMTTRSMTARSSRPNLLGPSPTPTQEAPGLLTEMSIVTQTQTQLVQSNITPISSPSPLPTLTNDPSRPETLALAAGFPQPTRSSSADPIQHLPLPSLAPTADLQMNRELVTTDVEMDSETPETALTLASNFCAQLQSLQSQVDTVSVTSNSLSDGLNLATQTFQSQHDMTATSLNSLSVSLQELTGRTSQLQFELSSTREDFDAAILDLRKLSQSPTLETDFVRLETALVNQQKTISNLHQSLQLLSLEQQRLSENLQTLANDRSSNFNRVLHELQALSRALEESQTSTQRQLDLAELNSIESQQRLVEQIRTLTQENSTLNQRLQNLEALCERLARGSKSTPIAESETDPLDNGSDTPDSAPDSTLPLLLGLQKSLQRMETKMDKVEESIADSKSKGSLSQAVKFTTIPTSDDQAHCEFFIKQLMDQA